MTTSTSASSTTTTTVMGWYNSSQSAHFGAMERMKDGTGAWCDRVEVVLRLKRGGIKWARRVGLGLEFGAE